MRALLLPGSVLVLLGLACSGPSPQVSPQPAPNAPGPALRGTRAVRDEAPAPDRQPPIAGGCEVGPPKVSLSKGVFTAEICPNVEANAPIYVGLTVQDAEGNRKDLPYVTVQLDQRGKSVTIREEIPREFERYVAAIWATEIDPGPDAVLDNDLWVWPEWRHNYLSFEEIVPIRVQLLDSGGGAALVKPIRTSIEGIRPEKNEALPGTPWPVVDGGVAQKQRDYIEIFYKETRFRPFADRIRKALPKDRRVVVTAWEEAPEALVVAVGK